MRDGSSPRTAPWEVAFLWGAGDRLTWTARANVVYVAGLAGKLVGKERVGGLRSVVVSGIRLRRGLALHGQVEQRLLPLKCVTLPGLGALRCASNSL